MTSLPNRFAQFAAGTLDALFRSNDPVRSRALTLGVMVGLYLVGVWLWGVFFSWGNLAFDFLDWAEVTGPRLAVLQDAARQGVLPLHAPNTTALRGVTDRYLSIPDTPFSPQYLLLRFLSLGQYVFFDTLLLYTLGFAGLVWIARRYRLSALVFTVFFLLFNFNGYIVAHLAVGHSIWSGYFLLPFFVVLILIWMEQEQVGWRWVSGMVLVLTLINLQGFFHLFLWCLMFLALLILLRWRAARPLALAVGFAVLLSLPRLLPPLLALARITHEIMGGFSSLTDLFGSMIVLQDPDRAARLLTDTFPLGYWEIDFYLGLLGFAFVAWFGLLAPLRAEQNISRQYGKILLACLVMTIFSIGDVFGALINVFPVPPLTGERVTSRMFILPLGFLLVFAAINAQRWLQDRKRTPTVQVVLLSAVGLLFHDLHQHLRAWRVRQLDSMTYLFPKLPFDGTQHITANHADPLYTNLLVGGAVAALAGLVILLVLAVREGRSQQKTTPERHR